ncbi:hypothetical protein [uncultured Psychromonas sp.]|uniref:hypothetical protein n=1 Tax=uncultured Psychromonas sp. TaxID=173974 RepID=UPI00261F2DD4|nr:hypothetical protein [uncultured Psychromonas sp.]
MSDKLTDHDLISLYHQGAKEQPSTDLNSKILTLAEAQTNATEQKVEETTVATTRLGLDKSKPNKNSSTDIDSRLNNVTPLSEHLINHNTIKNSTTNESPNKLPQKKPLYKTWYGQLSTAASLVLVGVLYLQNLQPMQSIAPMSDKTSMQEQQQIEEQLLQRKSIQVESEALMERAGNKIIMQSKRLSQEAPQFNTDSANNSDSINNAKENLMVDSSVATKSQKLNITNTLQQIALYLDKDEKEQADRLFNELLTNYPEMTKELTISYEALLSESK